MLPILKQLLQDFEPFLSPVYFLGAWFLVFLLGSTLVTFLKDLIDKSKKMHSIPCPNCQYFTDDYRLKCTVQPKLANTESAISCPDFSLKSNY